MTCQHKYICCVLTVGIHITNSYYNKTVIVKHTLTLKLQITITTHTIYQMGVNQQMSYIHIVHG